MHDNDSAPPSPPHKRIRRDGWTVDRQVKFIMALNKTGSVTHAAVAAGMSRESAYRLRRRPGRQDFARAWDAAVARKGHTPAFESHTRARPAAAFSSRESHEGHASGGFARQCPSRPLRGDERHG